MEASGSNIMNHVTDRADQTYDLSGIPPPPVAALQAVEESPTLFLAGIPVLSPALLIDELRPLFMHLGINVDSLLEQSNQQTADAQQAAVEEAEAAAARERENGAFNCPICWIPNAPHPTVFKVCGHAFCGPCIAKAVARQKKCPTCRTKVTKRQLLRIFLS